MSRKKERDRTEEGKGGTRGPERAGRGGRLRRAAAVAAGLVLVAGLVAVALLAWNPGAGGSPSGPKTAAIVDQLNLTAPNPDFVTAATKLLEKGGYSVDYYSGEDVTVDFYRSLPERDYDFVVLRAHSGLYRGIGPGGDGESGDTLLALFTNEAYDQYKYFEDQDAGNIGKAFYREGGEELFAIGQGFVASSMRGRFDNTTIVMMGCDGLGSTRTAEAFIAKGAKAFVSWSQQVSASFTDAATERLLQKMLIEGLSTSDAVEQTAAEVGADPVYGAELRFLESGD
ncbi:MAG: hypothetical protein A2Z17_07265 [Gammaproteobacteria bacterium RBG_16_66_13]|nr:MAG: hypothetical protein A2Z17_07265 [Gammaproteobacteria bacterium RBG_16_66_13]